MSIHPFDEKSVNKEPQARLIVSVQQVDDLFTYEYNLELPSREFIHLGELKALAEGLRTALTRMEILIENVANDDDDFD